MIQHDTTFVYSTIYFDAYLLTMNFQFTPEKKKLKHQIHLVKKNKKTTKIYFLDNISSNKFKEKLRETSQKDQSFVGARGC